MRGRDLFLLPMTVIVGCGGTLWGGQNTYIALRNRTPLEISCAEYLRQRPEAAWLRLTGCFPDFEHIDVESSTRTTSSGQYSTPTAVYVRLRAARSSGEGRTRILLASDDDDMLALGSSLAQVSDALVAELSTSVEGLVESALTLSQRRRADLAALDLRLADDFVVIDRGERPRPLWVAVGALVLGLNALSLLVRRIRRWFRGDGPPLPRATLARRGAADDPARTS